MKCTPGINYRLKGYISYIKVLGAKQAGHIFYLFKIARSYVPEGDDK